MIEYVLGSKQKTREINIHYNYYCFWSKLFIVLYLNFTSRATLKYHGGSSSRCLPFLHIYINENKQNTTRMICSRSFVPILISQMNTFTEHFHWMAG